MQRAHVPQHLAAAGDVQHHELQGERERRPTELVDSVLRWVSLKELVFVFIACNVVAALIRDQDRLEFRPVWNQSLTTENYANKKFPLRGEKTYVCPRVLVT